MAYSNLLPWESLLTRDNSNVDLQEVNSKQLRTIQHIVNSIWDPTLVGVGQDAKSLKHAHIKVISVKIVNNAKLFSSYDCYRRRLLLQKERKQYSDVASIPAALKTFGKSSKLSFDINETYLFHGTDKDAAMKISEKGFDLKKTDPHAMYGQGIYFAETFTKADQYADPTKELTVLLCRVLLGNFYVCSKSSSGEEMLFREFVVYDGRQCFPEFVITYRRVGKKAKTRKQKKWAKKALSTSTEFTFNTSGLTDRNPVSELNEFYMKKHIDRPVYTFQNVFGGWMCTIKFQNMTAHGNGLRKRFAKREAAKEVWDELMSKL